MLRSNEQLKDASEAFFQAMKQTHTRLITITRNKLQALCTPDKDVSDLIRLKRLNDRPRFNCSTGERLKGSLMPQNRSILLRCKEESGRSYWKTGVREDIDEHDILSLASVRREEVEWDEALDA